MQIEGASLTLQEAFALAKDRAPQRTLRDSEREFLNYLRAFDAVDDLRGERDADIRLGDIRNLHALLVDGVRGGERYAGKTRREAVAVGDRDGDTVIVHHQPPPWAEVDDHLRDLLAWLVEAKAKPTPAQIARGVADTWVHPVLVAGIAQHRFVWVHPFLDGNGRTARMLRRCCSTSAATASSTSSTRATTTTASATSTTRPCGPPTAPATTPPGSSTSAADSRCRCTGCGRRRRRWRPASARSEARERPRQSS